jgi:RNA polymerase sigma factor
MDSIEFNNLVRTARDGDDVSRDYLIDTNRGFIRRVSSYLCKRNLDWANDDELSIALIAFNEAIDSFDQDRGVQFLSYCRMLINSRLIDYFRKNSFSTIALSNIGEEELFAAESKEAFDRYSLTNAGEERALEVRMLNEELSHYGLSMIDLTNNSPKHRDTRKTLFKAAILCCKNKDIIHALKKNKMLPLKEIERITGHKRKFLEQWRKYIVTLLVITSSDEYYYLKEYIDFGEKEGKLSG